MREAEQSQTTTFEPHRAPGAVWVLATKGWNETTLQTPSEVATSALGNVPVVALAGPALAAEIFTDSPSGLLCASHDRDARRCAAAALTSPTTAVFTTSDLAGAETAAAFKNVVAVAGTPTAPIARSTRHQLAICSSRPGSP